MFHTSFITQYLIWPLALPTFPKLKGRERLTKDSIACCTGNLSCVFVITFAIMVLHHCCVVVIFASIRQIESWKGKANYSCVGKFVAPDLLVKLSSRLVAFKSHINFWISIWMKEKYRVSHQIRHQKLTPKRPIFQENKWGGPKRQKQIFNFYTTSYLCSKSNKEEAKKLTSWSAVQLGCRNSKKFNLQLNLNFWFNAGERTWIRFFTVLLF